jgi:hypothetical protein
MFADRKIATALGAVGVVVVLGHVVLGPEVVPPAIGLPGAGLAAAAGLYIALVRRHGGARSEGSSEGGP